jgi:hypothetical protein
MGLTLTSWKDRARFRIELRGWWEAAPPGNPVVFRDAGEARAYLASIATPSELAVGLRGLLHRDTPWRWPPPDDRELVEHLAAAVVAGRVRVAERAPEAFPSWDDGRGERRPSAPLFRESPPDEVPGSRAALPAAAPEPVEEVCWPCQRGAASARALREASDARLPFIVDL